MQNIIGFRTSLEFRIIQITQQTLLGPVKSFSAGGWGYGGNVTLGYRDMSGEVTAPTWINFGLGIGFTWGASYGFGRTFQGW